MSIDDRITCPKKRSIMRWYKLSIASYTLLRALQYEAIEGLSLKGKVLDIGCGYDSQYHSLLKTEDCIETINISMKLKPTYLLDIEKPLPFLDESFDHVISLNTFEHIKNDELAISEALRVLKRGGTFHFLVPFCYRVHGSPSDYHRHTSYWWSQFIAGLGVSNYAIEPLVWSPRSSAHALLATKGLWRSIVMGIGLIDLAVWIRRIKDLFPFFRGKPWRPGASRTTAHEHEAMLYRRTADFALGYYIKGTR